MTRLAAKVSIVGATVLTTLAGWGILAAPQPAPSATLVQAQPQSMATPTVPTATPAARTPATAAAPTAVATPAPQVQPPTTRPAPIARSRSSR